MRSILTTALVFFLVTASKAQDLVLQIPADAKLVATVKGNKFLDLLSVNEFNNSYIGKRILSKLSRETNSKKNDIQDFGIDLNTSFYYYLRSNDSIYFNYFLLPVKSIDKLEKLISEAGNNKIIMNGGVHSFIDSDSSMIWQWNDKQLLVVKGFAKDVFFNRDDVAKRYGIENQYDRPLADSTVFGSSVDSVAVAPDVEMIPPSPDVKISDDTIIDVKPAKKAPAHKKPVAKKGTAATKKKPVRKAKPVQEEPFEDVAVEPADSVVEMPKAVEAYDDSKYYSVYNKKRSLVGAWTVAEATAAFAKPVTNSIITNPSFVKSMEPNDNALLWVANPSDLYSSFAGKYMRDINAWHDWGAMSATLLMDKNVIKATTRIELSNDVATAYKRMYSSKLNKKILKYINEDRMIGYVTCAMSTKNYLEESPKMLARIYGSKYADEAALGADFFSLFLDEEAVGKVLKGDGIFIFSGISQKEVSYKTYEYDDNYKSIEIEKKKNETLPDFMFMTSTEDPSILQKMINYGIKKNVIGSEKGYYKINIPNYPIDLFVMIKDGILFIGTNRPEIEKVAANNFDAKISKETKKSIMNNYFTSYFSPKKLAGKIPMDEYSSAKTMKMVNNLLNTSGDIYFISHEIKDNILSGSIMMNVPAGEANSLKYLFSLIEKAMKEK